MSHLILICTVFQIQLFIPFWGFKCLGANYYGKQMNVDVSKKILSKSLHTGARRSS